MNVRSSWRIGHAAIDREARLDTNCNALPIKYQPTVEIISPAVASPAVNDIHQNKQLDEPTIQELLVLLSCIERLSDDLLAWAKTP